jgi:hypothetical protein
LDLPEAFARACPQADALRRVLSSLRARALAPMSGLVPVTEAQAAPARSMASGSPTKAPPVTFRRGEPALRRNLTGP